MFFVYGYGGTGKTFIWRTLLPGGRTSHSRFKIPFDINEDSTCHITHGSALAELIHCCKLIICDKAPMMHKHCFEALDRTMRDIMAVVHPWRVDLPFGGKTIVFGGDFQQIPPVIPKGSRQDIVNATINSSYLWKDCVVLKLTVNMRLQRIGSNDGRLELKAFADWIASIGDGTVHASNDGYGDVNILDNFLVKGFKNPIVVIAESTYPGYGSGDYQLSSSKDTAILAPTLDVVDSVNNYMVALNNSEGRVYLSSDSPFQSESTSNILNDIQIPEFLNSIKASGMPNHELQLKIGTPVMLLRNIDHSLGLCNETRLLITRLGDHVLEGQVILKDVVGYLVLIPRLSLTPSDPRISFKFQRKQFSLMVS